MHHMTEMNQTTLPVELPIKGSVSSDEIELRIESETHKYFYIQGKQLRLHRPLDRDGSVREVSFQPAGQRASEQNEIEIGAPMSLANSTYYRLCPSLYPIIFVLSF